MVNNNPRRAKPNGSRVRDRDKWDCQTQVL